MGKKCTKHKKKVKKYDGDLKSLAEDIGDLHYEALSELLGYMSRKFLKDSNADLKRGRDNLSNALFEVAECIDEAQMHMEKAWDISKPFME